MYQEASFSLFFFFFGSDLSITPNSGEHPGLSNDDVSKKLGEMWNRQLHTTSSFIKRKLLSWRENMKKILLHTELKPDAGKKKSSRLKTERKWRKRKKRKRKMMRVRKMKIMINKLVLVLLLSIFFNLPNTQLTPFKENTWNVKLCKIHFQILQCLFLYS